MDPHEKQEKQRAARRRLNAQRSRAGFLRGRVIAASILCFGLLWTVVFAQMATGNDPVLSAKTQASARLQSTKRRRSHPSHTASEAVETTEPRELEREFVEPEVVEEPELEPLTTGQS